MNPKGVNECHPQDCFQQMLSGDFSHIPPFESNIIRIFLSSTFGDFIHERNKLMHDVFPVLRRMCKERGVEFEVVDMRWGVTDAAISHHLTSAICRQEIRNCQRLSIGPTFVALLGNRYGYRPLPSQIPLTDFEILMQAASRHSTDANVLQVWYLRDDNAVPPAMELQPVTSHFPNCDSSDTDLRRKDQDAWWSVFKDLQRLIWQLATWAVEEGTMTAEHAHKYLISVTEDEILHGIFKSSSPSKHCLCYLREISGINLSDSVAHKYIDMSSMNPPLLDIQAQRFLSDLKFKKIPFHLESQNISSFSLPWFDRGIDPSLPQHKKYLDDFCSQVHVDLKKMIDSSLQNRSEFSVLFREVLHHASFCMSKCENFCGCENTLSQIREYIQGRTLKPLVLYGASGAGKTSVMAMASSSVQKWFVGTAYCIVRFLGTTPQSSTIREVLISICHQVCTLFNFTTPDFQQMDVHEVVKHFANTIANVGSQTDCITLAIFLDSVDQLSAANGAHSLKWLPKLLPPNVHIIVSMLPELHGCLAAIQSVITDEDCYIEIPSMSVETGIDILESWLAKSNRTITCPQKEVVGQAFATCPQPLYMKLVFHEALKWKSYTSSFTISLPHSAVSAISNFFQSLETQHGKTLVHHALGYISAAKNGITEAELEDVLSLDDTVLDCVYQYWDPPVTGIVRLPPLLLKRVKHDITEYIVERMADGKAVLSWYHRQFVEAACHRYLQLSDASDRHALLAIYFEGKWSEGKSNPLLLSHRQLTIEVADRQVATQPALFSDGVYNIRKLNELPFHLIASGQQEQLKLLTSCNFQWLLVKLLALPFSNLMYEFSAATSAFPNDEELQMLSDCMSLSATNLRTDPYSLAGQLLGRLHVAATVKYPFLSSLLQQARGWANSCNCCTIIPRATCLISPGGPLKTTLSAHPFRLDVITVMNLQSRMLTVSASKASDNSAIFNMWDMSSLDCIDILQSVTIESHGIACSPSVAAAGDLLVGAFGNRVVLWNARTCEELQTFTVSEGVKALALTYNKTICILTITGNVVKANIKEGSLSVIESEGLLEEISHIYLTSKNALIICSEMGEVQVVSLNRQIVECAFSAHVKRITCLSVKDYANMSIGITGSEDCMLAAIDLTHGKIINKLRGHSRGITCVCQHMLDSSTPLAVSGSLDNSVFIWKINSGVLLHKCAGHTNAVWCLSLLEPNLVVSGSKDDYLKVWDIETGLCTCTLEGHSSWISCVAATGKDVIVSGSNDKKVKVWKLHPPTLPQLERHSMEPDCIVANKNGIVISGSRKDIKVWNSSNSSCLHTWQQGASCLATDGCNQIVSGSNESLVSLWDLVSFNKICDIEGHTGSVTSVAISADHTKIMSASTDHTIHLWELETCSILHILKHCTPVKCMSVSPTGKTLVSGSYSGRLYVWDLYSFECKAVLSGHVKVVGCIVVLEDNGTIISGSDDYTLRIWDAKHGSCIHVVTYKDSVKAIAVSPNNSFVIAGAHHSVDQLRMWDLRTGYCLVTFCGHTHAVMCMLLIFDGKFLITGSRDGTIKVWCVHTGQQCASFDLQSQVKYIALCSESVNCITLAATTKPGPAAFLDVSLPQLGL